MSELMIIFSALLLFSLSKWKLRSKFKYMKHCKDEDFVNEFRKIYNFSPLDIIFARNTMAKNIQVPSSILTMDLKIQDIRSLFDEISVFALDDTISELYEVVKNTFPSEDAGRILASQTTVGEVIYWILRTKRYWNSLKGCY